MRPGRRVIVVLMVIFCAFAVPSYAEVQVISMTKCIDLGPGKSAEHGAIMVNALVASVADKKGVDIDLAVSTGMSFHIRESTVIFSAFEYMGMLCVVAIAIAKESERAVIEEMLVLFSNAIEALAYKVGE